MKNYRIKTAANMAFTDITEYHKQKDNRDKGEFFVTSTFLNSKETRKLNRLLGLHKVNKQDNINNISKRA